MTSHRRGDARQESLEAIVLERSSAPAAQDYGSDWEGVRLFLLDRHSCTIGIVYCIPAASVRWNAIFVTKSLVG